MSNLQVNLNQTYQTQVSMPVSNSNNAHDPCDNATIHEGAQQIINRERDESRHNPNTRVNNKSNAVDGT